MGRGIGFSGWKDIARDDFLKRRYGVGLHLGDLDEAGIQIGELVTCLARSSLIDTRIRKP
jgi:hypothetical protein